MQAHSSCPHVNQCSQVKTPSRALNIRSCNSSCHYKNREGLGIYWAASTQVQKCNLTESTFIALLHSDCIPVDGLLVEHTHTQESLQKYYRYIRSG